MADMTRDELMRWVQRQLPRREFTQKLVRAEDGSVPILVALPKDLASDILERAHLKGGVANVVTPMFDGALTFSVTSDIGWTGEKGTDLIDAGCTIGLLVQRMMVDGGQGSYAIVAERKGGAATTPHVLSPA